MDKFTDIDGIRMHYLDEGPADARVLVVMHGWGCNCRTVRSISDVALSCGLRVLTVDFPGFGDSPEPPSVWGIEEYTHLIEEFTRQLNLKRVSLLGHSFGGRVGILYASRNNNVDKLILVDAAGIKPRRKLSYYIKVYSFKAGKAVANALLPRERAAAVIEGWRSRRGSADYNQASPRMRAILSKLVNEDLKAVMPQIKAPTLLIWGENDTATPAADARYMEKHIPDAGLVMFAGCGHYSFLDNPVGFAAVLRSFLTSKP